MGLISCSFLFLFYVLCSMLHGQELSTVLIKILQNWCLADLDACGIMASTYTTYGMKL